MISDNDRIVGNYHEEPSFIVIFKYCKSLMHRNYCNTIGLFRETIKKADNSDRLPRR
jgi:hypothetical protein